MLPGDNVAPQVGARLSTGAIEDRRLKLPDIYLLLVRLFLGYVFASAGLAKITQGQFGGLIGPSTTAFTPGLESVWPFLAFSQVSIGALVLSGRWALLGLLGLVPMNAGILAYTLANQWSGTTYVNAFLLLLNVAAVAAEWRSILFLVLPEAPPVGAPRLVQLWPGWRLPLLSLSLLIGAAALGFSRLFPAEITAALGTLGIAVAWLHGLRTPDLSRLERAALAVPAIAVAWLSLAPVINPGSAPAAMLLGLGGGAAAVAIVTASRLWLRSRTATSKHI